MFKTVRGRLIPIVFMMAVAGWQLYSHGLKLGLDLQGGMHLVLEVDDPQGTLTADAQADMIDRVERIVRTRINELGVEEPLIQKVGNDRLIVELAGIRNEDQAKEVIQRAAFLEFKLVKPTSEVDQVAPPGGSGHRGRAGRGLASRPGRRHRGGAAAGHREAPLRRRHRPGRDLGGGRGRRQRRRGGPRQTRRSGPSPRCSTRATWTGPTWWPTEDMPLP